MNDKKQIKEMAKDCKELAKIIRTILVDRTDILYTPDLAFPIAKEVLKHYQPKLPEDSVVLTKDRYTYLTLWFDTFAEIMREVEELKSKETATEIYNMAKRTVDATKYLVQGRAYLHIDALKEIVKSLGAEVE